MLPDCADIYPIHAAWLCRYRASIYSARLCVTRGVSSGHHPSVSCWYQLSHCHVRRVSDTRCTLGNMVESLIYIFHIQMNVPFQNHCKLPTSEIRLFISPMRMMCSKSIEDESAVWIQHDASEQLIREIHVWTVMVMVYSSIKHHVLFWTFLQFYCWELELSLSAASFFQRLINEKHFCPSIIIVNFS